MDTFIPYLSAFVASIINDACFHTSNIFDSSLPITLRYSPLSSSFHTPRHRVTDWQHTRKHAFLISSEHSERRKQAQVGNAVPLHVRSLLQRPEQEETMPKHCKNSWTHDLLSPERAEDVFLAVTSKRIPK